MTTIPELPAATATAATDLLPVSQNGILRAATVAQATAGLQPTLALATGQILGRISAGSGGVETITVGANLTMASGTLAATAAPFVIAGLPAGTQPATTDLVAMSQSSTNTALTYAQLMGGLSGLTGLDVSHLSTTPTGLSLARHLADQMADAVPVEAFGAVGDGITDDTTAIYLALSSGRPARLGSKTYIVNGQLTLSTANAALLGIPGQSRLRRLTQTTGSAWISIQASNFTADGVIFDANKAAVTSDNWAVLVTAACLQSDFHRCVFTNAGGATLGHGLTFLASDPALVQHTVRDCEFATNSLNGLWVQACQGVLVEACRAHDNGQYGIVLDYNDATFVQKIHTSHVIGNRAWNNQRGIVVGNFNATNGTPPVWSNANPDANAVLVIGNLCYDNTYYGLAVSGFALLVHGNLCNNNGTTANSGAGILANISDSRVTANMVTGTALYGIDCGGSLNAHISANHVIGNTFGINCGGGQAVRVDGNTLQDFTSWAILVNNVETDGHGNNFGIACNQLALTGNWIAMTSTSASGILLKDGPEGVLVARNDFVGSNGAALGNCLWANTDQIIIEDNRWNFTQLFYANPTLFNGLQTVLLPDIADSVMITSAASGVQSMLTLYQTTCYGQISFIRVTAGGTGYTSATIAIAGPGTGAAATAVISNGAIIGIVVTAPGSGYGTSGAQIAVTITGNGTGATATATAGVPIPNNRRMRVRCNTAVHFYRSGSSPVQENWTGTDITAAINSDVEWSGVFNTWRASFFSSANYLAPDALGGAALTSFNNGDVQLHPAGTGHLRLVTDAEATGAYEMIGRNTPQGAVTAPPGSTFRNLNGGVGSTFYVKQTGTGNTGWAAIG